MGMCLQFEWRHDDVCKPVYTSIDLVPVFTIELIDTKVVIKLVNSSMIASMIGGWFKHLRNFLREDRLVEELWSEGETVDKGIVLE